MRCCHTFSAPEFWRSPSTSSPTWGSEAAQARADSLPQLIAIPPLGHNCGCNVSRAR
jgi:hypothetical protein